MSVREIMIKGHFLVTLVVGTGQTHNFGTGHSVITNVPFIESTHQTFRAREYD